MSFDIQNNKRVYIMPEISDNKVCQVPKIKESSLPEMPLGVSTALDCLLDPSTDMFCGAQALMDLMTLESMSLDCASSLLGLSVKTINLKLSLLVFSKWERKCILRLEYSQGTAAAFARLEGATRKAALRYCRDNGYSSGMAKRYADVLYKQKNSPSPQESGQGISVLGRQGAKGKVACTQFLYNSLDRAVSLAKNAGINVDKQSKKCCDGVEVIIRVSEDKRRNPDA